ncbi:hypothetical protein Tco_1094624 [Tanacetum coccineum]|uniref:Uncharacterized protein n=1 Tax=Tanacetum coccineum TaxID=301880 RepID=A0ABQ5IG08_9ASTR
MANQEQIPQQQDPQDQPERPASPIPFAPVKQVGFNLEYIIFNPNNELLLDLQSNIRNTYPSSGTQPKHSRNLRFSSLLPLVVSLENSALETNHSQPPASTPMDVSMHKEDQQVAGGPTSLGVTSEEGAHPYLSSGMSASNFNQSIFSVSFIIHSESALGHDALVDSTAKVDPRKSIPYDSIPQQQGLEIVLTTPETGKGASTTAKQFDEIKLEDLSKLLQYVPTDFMDLDSLEDDPIIVVNESEEDEEDKDEGIHTDSNSQKRRLELEKNKVEAEVALLSAQPSFPNVIMSASKKTKDASIPSAGQAGTQLSEGE